MGIRKVKTPVQEVMGKKPSRPDSVNYADGMHAVIQKNLGTYAVVEVSGIAHETPQTGDTSSVVGS